MNKTIIVGMSGGVDSSVTALLLKREGYQVIGLFMKNWEEKDENGICTSTKDYEDVARTCDLLKIPYYSVNFVKEYQSLVFQEFLHECKLGLTPNPDVLCNREIKFKVLLDKALSLGGDFLATGHYARTKDGLLLKGSDPDKDQSYFLHAVSSSALNKTLFPVGHLKKPEVRRIAKEAGLSVHDKKDSTGICFIGKRNFKEFVSGYLGFTPGPMVDLKGKVLGEHDGLAYYTIGQRKGLMLGGEGEPWYVMGKDTVKNRLIIDRGKEHPALYAEELLAKDPIWISKPPKEFPFSCTAKIRYRQVDQSCTVVDAKEGKLKVRFKDAQRAITPGQSIVFYQNDVCLGGAKIVQPI